MRRDAKLEWQLHRQPGTVGSGLLQRTLHVCMLLGEQMMLMEVGCGETGRGMDMRGTRGDGGGTRGMARLRGARQVSGSSRQGDGKRQEAGVRGAGTGTGGSKGGHFVVLKSVVLVRSEDWHMLWQLKL